MSNEEPEPPDSGTPNPDAADPEAAEPSTHESGDDAPAPSSEDDATPERSDDSEGSAEELTVADERQSDDANEAFGSEVETEDGAEVAESVDDDDLLGGLQIESTEDISVPDRLIDQVIGQDHARDIIKKAAKQHRHVMMIGSPGTGKSMLAKAMTELLPKEELQDVLVYHNPDDGNEPKVRTVPAGKGEQIVDAHKEEARKRNQMRSFLMWIIIAVVVGYALLIAQDVLLGILAAGVIYLAFRYGSRGSDSMIPNLIVNNADTKTAPFEDATGAHA
ncbi:MAG: ATP-binding protein, partial [Halobacteriales archaeon]